MLTCNRRKNFIFSLMVQDIFFSKMFNVVDGTTFFVFPFKEFGEKISFFLLIFNGFWLYINVRRLNAYYEN